MKRTSSIAAGVLAALAVQGSVQRAVACTDPFPPGTQVEVVQNSTTDFDVILHGGGAFGSTGVACSCALTTPIKLGCTVDMVTSTPPIFGTFLPNATATTSWGTIFSPPPAQNIAAFASNLLGTALPGTPLALDFHFNCTSPTNRTKFAKTFSLFPPTLGTGPLDGGGNVDTSNPAHVGVTTGLAVITNTCPLAVNKALGKFAVAKTKCLVKCDAGAFSAANPASDCVPPFAGATASCVGVATSKAGVAINAKCVPTCPPCYRAQVGGTCAAYTPYVIGTAETEVDGLLSTILCDDSGSGDGLTSTELKCRDKALAAIGKFLAAKDKCYAKCRTGIDKGKIPFGSCNAGAVTDPKALLCISKAEAKANTAVTGACADPPECLAPQLASLVATAEGVVDAHDAARFCGSPSGAFLDEVTGF